jgi:hypothetical protein
MLSNVDIACWAKANDLIACIAPPLRAGQYIRIKPTMGFSPSPATPIHLLLPNAC